MELIFPVAILAQSISALHSKYRSTFNRSSVVMPTFKGARKIAKSKKPAKPWSRANLKAEQFKAILQQFAKSRKSWIRYSETDLVGDAPVIEEELARSTEFYSWDLWSRTGRRHLVY